eukprot:TRINITY_DN2122_c4_g1_i1.p1 TRINITY_DN2122_c4_g1~~TRINITY_DN2122_c4_g1_i1.p1  ORF type:complete len:358 (+),score=54.90 TRINITY_DN2122_c4_g1_i1:85-1158(+)
MEQRPGSGEELLCEVCGKSFSVRQARNAHMRCHKQERKPKSVVIDGETFSIPLEHKRCDLMNKQITLFGIDMFLVDRKGDYVCFFEGCGDRMKKNFSRHLMMHQHQCGLLSERHAVLLGGLYNSPDPYGACRALLGPAGPLRGMGVPPDPRHINVIAAARRIALIRAWDAQEGGARLHQQSEIDSLLSLPPLHIACKELDAKANSSSRLELGSSPSSSSSSLPSLNAMTSTPLLLANSLTPSTLPVSMPVQSPRPFDLSLQAFGYRSFLPIQSAQKRERDQSETSGMSNEGKRLCDDQEGSCSKTGGITHISLPSPISLSKRAPTLNPTPSVPDMKEDYAQNESESRSRKMLAMILN